MFGFNNKKKEQIITVGALQMEDDAFHRNIIALERLELFLNSSNDKNVGHLQQTAVGTSRDLHDENAESTAEMCYLELQLACKGLYMCASYKDPEMFKIAVEAFMKDLLEWYGGRNLLEYYDSVDAAIIPMMAALSRTSKEIDALFEKYVYKASDLANDSVEDKYDAVKSGMNAWLKAQHILDHEMKSHTSVPENQLITSHFRGTALEGYKRLVAALTNLFSESAPLKIFVKMVSEYLPDVSSQLPSINLESIDKIYSHKEADNAPVDSTVQEPEVLSEDSIKIDLSGLEDENPTIPASNRMESKEPEKVTSIPEKEERGLSKEETYSRILKLADEIIDLVKSLKSEN